MTQRSSSSGDQFSVGGSMSGFDTNTGKTSSQGSTTQEIMSQAQETASSVADQAKDQAGQLADQARTQVASRISTQKELAADSLGSVAQVLRQTGQQLRYQDQSGVTQYVDQAANQVERLSNYLKQNEVGDLVHDVERFARQQPALFIGGAFTLGLLAARFLKSSSPQGRDPYMRRGYTGSRRYDATTYGTPNYNQGYTDRARISSPYSAPTGVGGTYGNTMGTNPVGSASYDAPARAAQTGLVGDNTSDASTGFGAGQTGASDTTTPSTFSTYGSTESSRERGGREGL